MHYTLEALLKSQESLLEYYGQANAKWSELFGDDKALSKLDEWLAREETAHFEKECGGMFIGREVMGWSGFAALYSIQFGWQAEKLELARKLAAGFAGSDCSAETKEAAAAAAAFYGVEDAGTHAAAAEG